MTLALIESSRQETTGNTLPRLHLRYSQQHNLNEAPGVVRDQLIWDSWPLFSVMESGTWDPVRRGMIDCGGWDRTGT